MGIIFLLAATHASADWTPEPLQTVGSLAGNAVAWERSVRRADRTVGLSGVSFSTAHCAFRVLDNPPQDRRSLSAALEEAGAVAGVNGGYFHPDDRPLGLVVADGETLHGFERAKLLSGVLLVRKNHTTLLRAEKFSPSDAIAEALQAGPWLVEDGQPVPGLHRKRRARRTVVATDGGAQWTILTTTPVSLAELAGILTLPRLPGGFTIQSALNLDGGSSTLLIAREDGRTVLDIPSFGPVRNYLAIIPQQR